MQMAMRSDGLVERESIESGCFCSVTKPGLRCWPLAFIGLCLLLDCAPSAMGCIASCSAAIYVCGWGMMFCGDVICGHVMERF